MNLERVTIVATALLDKELVSLSFEVLRRRFYTIHAHFVNVKLVEANKIKNK